MKNSRVSWSELRMWLVRYIEGADNPDLRAYGNTLLTAAKSGKTDRYLWLMKYLMDLGRIYDSRVLDVGCGFGWQAMTISMLGSNAVVANDIRELMTSALCERMTAMRDAGACVDVTPLTGDICSLDLEPCSFDVVFSNQTVEHVHDLKAMFARCACLLREGGRCVIVNDNNVFNQRMLTRARTVWKERDRSSDFIEELKKQRPIENRDIQPYAVMREEIIRSANPQLTDDVVVAMVDASAGLTAMEIEVLAKNYRRGDELPTPPEFSWCRNPITAEYCERLLDPFAIRELMQKHGFKTKIRHAFRKLPLRLVNAIACSPLNKCLFNLRPVFILVGEKC